MNVPGFIGTMAATMGCKARNEALKYLFSKPASEYR